MRLSPGPAVYARLLTKAHRPVEGKEATFALRGDCPLARSVSRVSVSADVRSPDPGDIERLLAAAESGAARAVCGALIALKNGTSLDIHLSSPKMGSHNDGLIQGLSRQVAGLFHLPVEDRPAGYRALIDAAMIIARNKTFDATGVPDAEYAFCVTGSMLHYPHRGSDIDYIPIFSGPERYRPLMERLSLCFDETASAIGLEPSNILYISTLRKMRVLSIDDFDRQGLGIFSLSFSVRNSLLDMALMDSVSSQELFRDFSRIAGDLWSDRGNRISDRALELRSIQRAALNASSQIGRRAALIARSITMGMRMLKVEYGYRGSFGEDFSEFGEMISKRGTKGVPDMAAARKAFIFSKRLIDAYLASDTGTVLNQIQNALDMRSVGALMAEIDKQEKAAGDFLDECLKTADLDTFLFRAALGYYSGRGILEAKLNRLLDRGAEVAYVRKTDS